MLENNQTIFRNGKQKTGLISLVKSLPKYFRVCELGSFAGESTEIFARHFDTVFAVDLWSDCATNIAVAQGSTETAKDIENRFDLAASRHNNIIKIKDRSDIAYDKFWDESLDFVYIDAMHDYDSVLNDIKLWLPKIKLGGYIGGHDYNPISWPGCIQAVTEIFGDAVQVFEDTSWIAKVSEEKISLLMPVYNRASLVGASIQSLLNQTYKNIDLVVYDDGSTDNTVKVVEAIASVDKRVKLIRGEKNKGCAEARNILLNQTKTRLAGWVDSDDLHNKYKLEIQFPHARNGKTVVFTASKKFHLHEESCLNLNGLPDKKSDTWKGCNNVGTNRCKEGFFCDYFTPCTLFPVDKSCKLEYGTYGNLIGDDCVFLNQMSKKYTFILLQEVLGFYRLHENSLVHIFGTAMSKLTKEQFSSLSCGEIIDKVGTRVELKDTKYFISENSLDRVVTKYKNKADRAIVTVAGGNFYRYVSTMTHPTIKKYSENCEADFIVLFRPEAVTGTCHWIKFEMEKLLKDYKRVLYIDTDILVKDGTPNLFNIVPEDSIGIFNELELHRDFIVNLYIEYLNHLGLSKQEYFDNSTYYNSGVMLFSREHKNLLHAPTDTNAFYMSKINDTSFLAEQHYININIKKYKLKIFDVGPRFNYEVRKEVDNRILGVNFSNCQFLHLAGTFCNYYKYEDFVSVYEHAESVILSAQKRLEGSNHIDSVPIRKKVKMFPALSERISVLMPVYNRERFVGQAIESILRQTYKNWEMIICDDGSTDGTPSILDRYARMDNRIRVIRNEKNKGIPVSRNILLTESNADFACWQDSDDISNIHRLDIQRKLVRGDLIIKTNCQSFPGNSSVNYLEPPRFQPVRVNCLPSVMFPVLKHILCQEKFQLCGEDDDWISRMEKECKMLHIPDILYYYRVWDGRITAMKGQILSVLKEEDIVGKTYEQMLELYKARIK